MNHFVHGSAAFQKGKISFNFASPFSIAPPPPPPQEILFCLLNLKGLQQGKVPDSKVYVDIETAPV